MSKQNKSGRPQFNGISYSTTIGAAVAAAVGAGPALAQEKAGIEEITVTATKRGAVSIMDIAGSIQAFDTAAIRNQNLFNMEDFSKFTPSLTYFGNATGNGKIYFRGIADAPDTFIASSSSAVYLDEQPVTSLNGAVDVRLVDIERVEALSGPQGTLFGSSSQSGTLRIVTNKPDPTKFEAFADASFKGMSEGDPSTDISAMVNIPLAEDKFAVRLVGFTATDGGFIDNVLGTTGNCEALGKCPVEGPQYNTDAVEKNWNETTVSGGRASAKWFINDTWSATFGIATQSADIDAENTYDPTVGDLELIAFSADTFKDDWTQYALTFEGQVGKLNFTSATAYFERDSSYTQDTTEYAAYFGSFCYYWTATYNVYCFQPAGTYYWYADPVGFLHQDTRDTSFSQEFRVSYSGERVDWVGGVFWEDRHQDWKFETFVDGYGDSQGFDNWTRPSSVFTRPTGTVGVYYEIPDGWGVDAQATDGWWLSADDTDWETMAVFGEATFHISDKFSVTAGARWFEVDQKKEYYVELPIGRLTPGGLPLLSDPGSGPGKWGCLVVDAPCNFLDTDNPADDGLNRIEGKDNDTAIRVSAQYNLTEDVMIYGLYSEGFRAGGVNRNRGVPLLPQVYGADFLENIEFGMKGSFAEGRLNISATAFFQDWIDYQVEVVDPSNTPCGTPEIQPCGQPWQKGVLNAGNAHSDGIEIQIEAQPNDQLSLRLNATMLESELDEDNDLIDAAGKGSKLPFAPDFKASAYAQYNWPTMMANSQESFFQVQVSYVGDSLNQIQAFEGGATPQIKMESYGYFSAKYGLVGDDWEVNLFVNNISDRRGQLYHDITDFEPFFGRQRTSVIRPREFGVRFFKRWGE
jgi:outer membrane receptor protein involved in Fe transport